MTEVCAMVSPRSQCCNHWLVKSYLQRVQSPPIRWELKFKQTFLRRYEEQAISHFRVLILIQKAKWNRIGQLHRSWDLHSTHVSGACVFHPSDIDNKLDQISDWIHLAQSNNHVPKRCKLKYQSCGQKQHWQLPMDLTICEGKLGLS